MASVELIEVGKTYPNGFEAVRAFSMDIAAGEFVVMVGPSGCGKSTSLRMVAGLESISTGELRIDGRRVNDVPPRDRNVAMVFQSYALYPHMTVFQNMAFGLELQKVPAQEIKTRVSEVAELLDIAGLLDRKPGQMSGGQRQRVAMGRAIVRRPGVFLFDEPLSNLDARLRLQMRIQLAQLHRDLGATSLYVTHDQVEAMTLADRIVLLKDGQVQQIGAPLELYEQPANEFVATFIGSPTMNLLDGMLKEGKVGLGPVNIPAPGVDGPVRMGIRPHDFRIVDQSQEGSFGAEVIVTEPMGHETIVYCRVGSVNLTVALEGLVGVRPGDLIHLQCAAERIHLFDPTTGTRR